MLVLAICVARICKIISSEQRRNITMSLRNNIAVLFLVFSLLFTGVSQLSVWGVYSMNKKAIASALCENVADPCCQGSCFVEQSTNASDSPLNQVLTIEFAPFLSVSYISELSTPTECKVLASEVCNATTLLGCSQSVFHPPAL